MYQHDLINFSMSVSDLQACLPICTAFLFFCIYWFIAQSARIKKLFYERYSFDRASALHISFTKLAGFFLMGVCPVLICLVCISSYNLTDYGLSLKTETLFFSFLWIIGLSMITIPLTWFSAKKP